MASSFQDNFRATVYGDNIKYATPTTIGNWPSGAFKESGQGSNMYLNQNRTIGGSTPKDPTGDQDFYTNYRNTTRELGSLARAMKTRGQKYPNVDAETKKIMSRIKLPTYNDVIPEVMGNSYMGMYRKDPQGTEKAFNEASEDFEEDNFYYKLRAAQILKNKPESIREAYLNNFNVSAYDAKNELDKLISNENEQTMKGIQALKNFAEKGINYANDTISDFTTRLLSNKRTETITDKNGNKQTITYTSGPADEKSLDEFAERLGDNNSFRLYSTDEYKNGELTDEAKSRGPSAWNSNTTNPDGTQKTDTQSDANTEDTGEVIEYTYKPGDTFGQVIRKLGLGTDKGLWGPDGDVEYYTKQLEDQLWKSGVWPTGERQNIPVGTTIKLKRRK